jgi:hypothetical protein
MSGTGRSWRLLAAALLAATLGLAAPFVPAAGADRLALVVGNSTYRESPLRNPINDARAMSELLRRLDFQVISLEDASKARLEQAIVQFTSRLGPTSTGLFYYAGHGVQVSGRNYLVPVDAELDSEREVRIETTPVNLLLDELSYAGNSINIVILDACRNNPFERRFRGRNTRGLAAIDAAHGTMIAYATAPGSVALDGEGNNGLYTEELLRVLDRPGLKVEEVFKQVRRGVANRTGNKQIPWESSSLIGDFVFNHRLVTGDADQGSRQADVLFWESIQASENPQAYRAYLGQFPNGVFATLANLRIAELEAASSARSSKPPSSFAVDGAMADTIASNAPAVTPGSPAGSIKLAPAPSAIAPDSSSSRGAKDQYVIAVLPQAGKTWCSSGFDEVKLVYNVIRALNRSPAAAASYFSEGTWIRYGESLVTSDNLWQPDGLRRRPNADRALEYGRKLEVDAVLLLWYEARGGGCNQTEVHAFLYDVALETLHTAEESASDLDDLSASLMDSLRAGRKVASEN